MSQTTTRITLDEFLALPEEEPALEFEDGMVTQKVSPKGRHSRLQTWAVGQFNIRIEPNKLGLAFTELRATFANMSRVPDVSVYRWDRIPRDVNGDVADDFTEPPDIAIEIVSPGQSVNRLIRRCLTFVDAGVLVAVLIDPTDRSVVVVRPGVEPIGLATGDTLDLSDIIPDLRLDVAALFESLRL
ncbi:MAG: Uma2 family endonuclease [Dehalococcoidia bacterium]